MFESADGFSVSLTRQCSGIGCGGAGGGPGGGGGAPAGRGGGVKTPAGTASDAMTVTCGVESVFRLSQAAVPASSIRPKASIRFSLLDVSEALLVLQAHVAEQFRIEHNRMMQR